MVPAIWNDRARRGFFQYRRFSPRDVELEPRRTSHGRGWRGSFYSACEGRTMALFRIRPTRADIEIADSISDHTRPEVEQIAQVLTWGADEHVICALAAGWWLYCRHRSARHRIDSNHILLTTVAVTLLPHLLKSIFDQKRPDRLMVRGHLHGVPILGKASRRLSIRPCHPCRRAGIGRHGAAARETQPGLVDRCGPGPDADRTAGALDQRCDRRPGDRSRGRTAAQALDGFRIVAPEIAGAGRCRLASQGRRRVPQGQSAPPAALLGAMPRPHN